MSKASIKQRLLLLLGGLTLGIVLAETSARLVQPIKSADLLYNASDSAPNLYVIDASTRLTPAPNLDTSIDSLDYSVRVRTNQLGLRGPELSEIDLNSGIALGDSFTMSVQVDESKTFASLLGQHKGMHIWNAGVDGFSTWQSTLRLLQLLPAIQPKVAILTFFTGNDYQDNERFDAMRKHPLPGAPGTPIPRPAVPATTKWLLAHSHLFAHYRLRQAQQALRDPQNPSLKNWRDELAIFSSEGKGRLQQLSARTLSALKQFKSVCKKHNIQALVAIAPPAFVVDQSRLNATFEMVGLNPSKATPDAPQEMLKHLLGQAELPFCELSTALRAASSPAYLTFDGHWSVEGHRIVAETLNRCLKKVSK